MSVSLEVEQTPGRKMIVIKECNVNQNEAEIEPFCGINKQKGISSARLVIKATVGLGVMLLCSEFRDIHQCRPGKLELLAMASIMLVRARD